jgi:hypothetical protein
MIEVEIFIRMQRRALLYQYGMLANTPHTTSELKKVFCWDLNVYEYSK